MKRRKVLYGRGEPLTPESAMRVIKGLESEGFGERIGKVAYPDGIPQDSIAASLSAEDVTPSSESSNNPANIKGKE